jgi:hypothetical protein
LNQPELGRFAARSAFSKNLVFCLHDLRREASKRQRSRN